MSDGAKSGNMKLGAAVLGGYIIGRLKKGKAAIRLAMWVSGNSADNQMLGVAKQGVTNVLQTEEIDKIVTQVRGPLVEALRNAALAQVSSRIEGLNTKIEDRTKALTTGAADTAKDTADKATRTVTRRKAEDEEEMPEEEAQSEPEEDEGEPEEPEEDEGYEDEEYEDEEEEEPEEPEEPEAEAEEVEEEEPEPEPEEKPKPRRRPRAASNG